MSAWLSRIEIASPCQERWGDMEGDSRQRHCSRCEQSVFDLSGLSQAEGEALVRRALGGEEVCVRLRRRADGTVLSADCPAGLQAGRQRGRLLPRVAAAALALGSALVAQGCEGDDLADRPIRGVLPSPPSQPADPAPIGTAAVDSAAELREILELQPVVMGRIALPTEEEEAGAELRELLEGAAVEPDPAACESPPR